MTSIDIDGAFDVEVNNRHPAETMIQFKLYGIVVHSERYPKYSDANRLNTAIADAKRRFAGTLRDSLKKLETV